MKDYHLPKKELQKLRATHKHAKKYSSPKTADRIKAVYLLGSGWKVSDICEALLVDDNVVYRYYDWYKSQGLTRLSESNHLGSEGKLTDRELLELDEHLQIDYWRTTKQVVHFVEQEFDVKFSISGMNSLLKRLGYTYKKPNCVPGKADREKQRKFLRKYRNIRRKMNPEDSLFFMDGVHPDTFRVKDFAKACAIKLLYLPPYSPNLNIIERLWQFLKKEVLYNRYYETFDKFKKSCMKFMGNLRFHKATLRSLLTENFQLTG